MRYDAHVTVTQEHSFVVEADSAREAFEKASAEAATREPESCDLQIHVERGVS